MPKFQLKSDYWDGRCMRKRGEVVDTEVAPKGSVPVEEPKPEPKTKSKPVFDE